MYAGGSRVSRIFIHFLFPVTCYLEVQGSQLMWLSVVALDSSAWGQDTEDRFPGYFSTEDLKGINLEFPKKVS